MTEVSGFEALSRATAAVQRKSSNMSTNSDDSFRKISSDSGIGIACAPGMGPMSRVPASYDDLVGEPKLSTDISAAMLLAHQQNLSAAATAAALNPAMLGLMSAGLGGLFANPLATAMLQQEAVAARKLLESPGNGGRAPPAGTGVAKPVNKEQFPSVYPSLGGLVQPTSHVSDQILPDSLRNQLLSRKFSEDLNGGGSAVKATRKANSFSGTSSSPLNRQFSPPTTSPNLSHSLSPNNRGLQLNGADERQPSPYRDDDSVGSSGKSSVRCRSPLTSNPLLDGQAANPYAGASELAQSSLLNTHQFHPSSRRRKNGIIGAMPMADISSYPQLGAYSAQPAPGNDVAMHKLSTASLPANLPSSRASITQDPLMSRGSPATSRKRQRTNTDEKDESYWERRRKNNEAAKRSRDSRRAKEDEIAIRAAFLEQENYKLRLELTKVKEELTKLQAEMEKHTKKQDVEVVADATSEPKAAENGAEEVDGSGETSPVQTAS